MRLIEACEAAAARRDPRHAAAALVQDAVLAWLQRRRCAAPKPRTKPYSAAEVRKMICLEDAPDAAALTKLGWKTLHQALTWLAAPNRGATKDLAARLVAIFDDDRAARAESPTCVAAFAFP